MTNMIEKMLGGVIHPAFDKNIVELGLIEELKVDQENKKIKFNLVFKNQDPFVGSIKKDCENILKSNFPDYKILIIELIKQKESPKKKDISQLGLEQLEGIGKIIAISSCKGGVGKSTVSVNLAITLAKMGYKVGLADADVYGPSIPLMTGTEGIVPEVEFIYEDGYIDKGECAASAGVDPKTGAPLITSQHGKVTKEILIPLEKYGVKWMSVGYFISPEQALIWRGPMACNALKQMILQVNWGELDFLLLDLPPGTGDIHISLVHDIPLSGAVIVTTPQDVALADVEKGINMFTNQKVNKPIYGVIENMSWFTPAELPDNKYYIFGRDGGKHLAERYRLPFLGQIPLIQSIRERSDEGMPSASNLGDQNVYFENIANKLKNI